MAARKLDTAAVTRVLASANRPVSWQELTAELGIADSTDRRSLRRVLKGMERNGELVRDHKGAWHLSGESGEGREVEGVIESMGMTLSFQGLPLERERRMVLRAGDRVRARVSGEEVRVLTVLERSQEPLIGVVRVRGRYPYVESLSPDYRGRVSLTNPEEAIVDGETVAVRVLDEDRRVLVGEIIERLEGTGGAAQAAVTLLAAHGVPTEWDPGIEDQLSRLPRQVRSAGHTARKHLMDLPLVTIDGVTAKDYDDAVFAERRQGGGWRLVVAIADVAHYVKIGSPLDRTAHERGNSVYLPDRVIPMLPEVLSNGLCSLNPRVARLAMVCEMTISRSGRVTGHEFHEAVIRSWQRLTYERVQEFLDEGALDVEPEVTDSLRCLHEVYQALRAAREERGALDFETHEARLELRNNRVYAIHPVHRLVAHQLIEEAMISANVAAAEFIESHLGTGRGMYRVHEPPGAEKLEQLRQTLALVGVRLPAGELTPPDVHRAMDQLGHERNRWLYEMMVLRSLTQAVYTPENKGHFGLALKRYMHFTSPIRRYADLIVHRIIKSILAGRETRYGTEMLLETGAHISATERRAETVGWGVDAWLKCEYVSDRVGEVFDGVIMGVTDFGLFVELKGYFVQGLLHISELGSDYFQYQPASMSLVGERSGKRFRLGDELRVRLTEAIPEQGRLDLVLERAPKSAAGRSGRRGEQGGRKKSGAETGRSRKGGGRNRRRS
jgi:ribonuclease R